MARMIDASRFGEILEQWKKDCLEDNDIQGADIISDVILQLDDMPTLTPPNEGAKDKNVPTNGPLTLEELRPMAEPTPVWWDQINSWVLVYKGNLTTWSGKHLYAKGCNGKFYRRPPEGEEEEKHVIEITENL